VEGEDKDKVANMKKNVARMLESEEGAKSTSKKSCFPFDRSDEETEGTQ